MLHKLKVAAASDSYHELWLVAITAHISHRMPKMH
jgi:hypothetical protein